MSECSSLLWLPMRFRSGLRFIEMCMPPKVFREQVAYLSRVYHVVSLGEYVKARHLDWRA